MKKPVIFGAIVFVVLFCAFSVWFWSLGVVIASEGVPPIRVDIVQGSVEIQSSGTDAWKSLTASANIAVGDRLRTNTTGKAEIHWGDRGITRVDPNTELQIESLPEAGALTNASIKMHLASGKVWNRMYKLLDVQSDIQVRTDTVVATVRGTAFGVGADALGFETAVTESVVNIGSLDGKVGSLVREGRWGRFAKDGSPEIIRNVTEQDTWVTEQRAKDQAFDQEMRRTADERLKRAQGKGPVWLRALSEQLHLATASEKEADELASAYAARRLADAAREQDEGSKTAAFVGLVERARKSPAAWQAYLSRVRDLSLVSNPADARGRTIRDAMWRLREQALGESPIGRRYVLALNIDDKIDELLTRPVDDSRERKAEQLRREIDEWQQGSRDGLTPDEMSKLASKADALRERLRDIGLATDVITPPPSTEPISATSTSSTPSEVPTRPVTNGSTPKPSQTESTTPVNTSSPKVVCSSPRVSLFIKPSTISLSQTAGLVLIKACADGSTEDVTSKSVFNVSDLSIADARGASLFPKKIGRVAVTGSFVVDGRPLTDTQTLLVSDAVGEKKLQAVRVTTNGPTILTTGQRAMLEATAVYADGTTKSVSYQCVWSTSNARLALISGNTFQHLQGTGSVDAICSYTESGVTVKGSLTFTIELDSALQPVKGKPGYQYPYSFVP